MQYLNIDSLMIVFRESNKRHMQIALKKAREHCPDFAPIKIGHCDHWSLKQVKMLQLHFKYNPIRHKVSRKRKLWYERDNYNPLEDRY